MSIVVWLDVVTKGDLCPCGKTFHFVFAVGVIVMTQGGSAMRRAVAGSLILNLLAGRTGVDTRSVLQRNFCQKILACILNSCKPSCLWPDIRTYVKDSSVSATPGELEDKLTFTVSRNSSYFRHIARTISGRV